MRLVEKILNYPHIILAVMLAAFLAIQLLAIMLLPANFGYGWDPEYIKIAENLVEKGMYSFDGENPTRMRQPLYPLFLAAVLKVAGPNFLLIEVIQAFIAILTLLFLYLTVANIWNYRAALISAILVFPFLSGFTLMIMSESLFTLFLITSLYFATLANKKSSTRMAILCGMLLGLATLTRPDGSFIPVLLLLAWCLNFRFLMSRWREIIKLGAAIAVVYILMILPWGLRNYRTMGEFTFSSANAGVTLWGATKVDTARLWEWNMTAGTWRTSDYYQEFDEVRGGSYYLSSEAHEKFKKKFFENVKNDPFKYISSNMYKIAIFWSVPPGSRTAFPNISLPLRVILTTLQLAFIIFALAGFWIWRASTGAILMLVLMFYYLLINTFIPPAERQLIHAEVFMLMLASAGIYGAAKSFLKAQN